MHGVWCTLAVSQISMVLGLSCVFMLIYMLYIEGVVRFLYLALKVQWM